jgi:uncharacterized protein with von Willebrand factor type A (vWA) domain
MGWDELMETLKKRLEEQKERHEGGNKWIGTGGTSPFGAYGYNPQGIRIGQAAGKQQERREGVGPARLQGLRRHQELGTRNIKVALRRLRKFAREGSSWSWTCPTPSAAPRPTPAAGHQDGARAAQQREGAAADGRGRHDGRAHPARGGTVLAAKTEFKHLEFYYFHNCVYDFMWKNNRRRFSEKFPPGTSSASTTRTTS